MTNWLRGKKTYFAAGALVATALLGLMTGTLDHARAAEMVFLGLGLFGLREAVARQASELIVGTVEHFKPGQPLPSAADLDVVEAEKNLVQRSNFVPAGNQVLSNACPTCGSGNYRELMTEPPGMRQCVNCNTRYAV